MSWEARTLSKQHRCKDIKDHTSARTGLSDTGKSGVEGEALINLKTGLKSMSKPTSNEDNLLDRDELNDALNKVKQTGALTSVKLDDAILDYKHTDNKHLPMDPSRSEITEEDSMTSLTPHPWQVNRERATGTTGIGE